MKVVSLLTRAFAIYEVSHINCGLGLCKKKIQVAFSSKKRLTKEYELLAIWFGDFDIHGIMRHELSFGTAITLDPDPETNCRQTLNGSSCKQIVKDVDEHNWANWAAGPFVQVNIKLKIMPRFVNKVEDDYISNLIYSFYTNQVAMKLQYLS